MSEREIKVGSKWRITGCELLVRDNDRCVVADFMDGHGQMEITTEAWHQIATWVSDPVETPKPPICLEPDSPLVKALDKLELAVIGFVGSDYEAKALVSEWRALKAKMGVKA